MKKLLLETSVSKIYILLVGLISLLIVGLYFSYAMFTVNKEKKNAITIVTGNLIYDFVVDGVSTDKLVIPKGTTKTYKVKLHNPNSRTARFNIYSKGNIDSAVNIGYLKEVGVDRIDEIPDIKGTNIKGGGEKNYIIRVINGSSSDQTITLGVSVGLDYNDLELPSNSNIIPLADSKPNAPVMDDNMIPVRYDGTKWVKAATDNWYNYDNGEWANAVTVKGDKLSSYQSLEVDKEVAMEDIETMWVWIPRYSYTIGSMDYGKSYYGKKGEYLDFDNRMPQASLPGEIDIEFISSNVKDRGTAKYFVGEGASGWYTPDAFTFDGKELDGIWVGKFETSSSTPEANYGGGNVTNLNPMIKPNVPSWRALTISKAQLVSLSMTSSGNIYNFSTTFDSHLMKNSEWGSVVYLSQSKYGKLGNRDFYGDNKKEVYMNNNSNFITGCSAGRVAYLESSTCDYTYNVDILGTGASTTGNIYGVYDMSGGSLEYTMANFNDKVASSGFASLLTLKYIDKYTDELNNISHALIETSGWYNDYVRFATDEYPWFLRGGSYLTSDEQVGIFFYGANNGGAASNVSFRVVLVS